VSVTIKQRIGKFLIPKLPMTKENFDRLRLEINAGVINIKNRIYPPSIYKINQLRKQSNISVNIGAGPFGKEGWINIDMFKMKNISLVYDCRSKLPFKDNSVSRIRCEHVFEHLDKTDEAPKFLKECRRALTDGGVLRIVVPDLELFVKAYVSNDNDTWKRLGFDLEQLPHGLDTPMDILNHTFRQNGEHKYGYDFITLERTLAVTGFSAIHRMEWGKSIDTELTDDLPNHRPYSLYVDCIK
jgi:predicted SAM-dependent methyltransferase